MIVIIYHSQYVTSTNHENGCRISCIYNQCASWVRLDFQNNVIIAYEHQIIINM